MGVVLSRIVRILLPVLAVAAFACFARADVLSLVTENRPPRQMQEGDKVVGTATDRVKRLMDAAGIPYSIAVYPFARSFHLAEQDGNTCIFSIVKNDEREKLFVWIDTPIMQIRRVFFARADANIKLRTIEDARNYRIGTYLGDAMDTYLKQRGFNVDAAPADMNNLQKLKAKRIDLWVNDEQIGQYEIGQSGESESIVPVFTIMSQNVYLACNPNVPAETIEKLQKAAKSVFRN
jgi:polar amino acid transport system substrate-binding protein